MDDAKTVLARPFPLSTTEDRVKGLFESIGRVKKVKLRRDEANQAFRGSVYVEFEGHADAASAVANPPLRPNSKTEPLEVILKAEYNRQKQQSLARQQQNGGKPPKRPRQGSSEQRPASGLPPPPPLPHSNPQQSDMNMQQEHMSYAAGELEQPGPSSTAPFQHLQLLQPHTSGFASSSRAANTASTANAVRRMQEAEQALAAQRDQNSSMLNKLLMAQAAAEEAQSREAVTARKLLAKEAEIGSLKGEVGAAKSMASARSETLQNQFKARIHDLEVQVHQLKDTNNMLRRERDQADARARTMERKLKALTAASATGGALLPESGAGGGAVKAEPADLKNSGNPAAGSGSDNDG